jgi:hypothetical protein
MLVNDFVFMPAAFLLVPFSVVLTLGTAAVFFDLKL